MENVTKETFDEIVELIKKLVDTHIEASDQQFEYSEKIVGKKLRIENTEGGRVRILLTHYLFNPIKGVHRQNVRREFMELGLSYPDPPGYASTGIHRTDTYVFFTDNVIMHVRQDLEMHSTGYVTYLDKFTEDEGQELLIHLRNIIEDEKQKGMIKEEPKIVN